MYLIDAAEKVTIFSSTVAVKIAEGILYINNRNYRVYAYHIEFIKKQRVYAIFSKQFRRYTPYIFQL